MSDTEIAMDRKLIYNEIENYFSSWHTFDFYEKSWKKK